MISDGGIMVWDPDDENSITLVLGFSHPFLLLPPCAGSDTMRTVPVDQVRFHSVRYNQPWTLAFQQPKPEEHPH